MSFLQYSLVVGNAVDFMSIAGAPHARLLIQAGDEYVVANINVRSHLPPHTLLFSSGELSSQLGESLSGLGNGIVELHANSDLSLDYVRDYLLDRSHALRIPYRLDDSANPVLHWLGFRFSALRPEMAGPRVFIWGNLSREQGAGTRDDPWLLQDVHMNQGNRGIHQSENRVNGDGGLVYESNEAILQTLFLGFTSQSWDTDDRHGNAIGLDLPDSMIETDAVVRIVSALLAFNQQQENGPQASVTLINRSDERVVLDQWRLEDHEGSWQSLKGQAIDAGECLRIPLQTTALSLRPHGGVLRLIADKNCLVHEVAYKEAEPLSNGWSVLFKN